MRITVHDVSRRVSHLGKVTTEFTRSVSSTRMGKPVFMMELKVSRDKHICRWIDWENLICVRWNRIKMCAQRKIKKVIIRGERSKTLSEIKPVENLGKNPQGFLEISHMQKEVLHINCEIMPMRTRIFFGLKEVNLSQRNCHNQLCHPFLSQIEQECQQSFIQGKFHNQKNSSEGLKYS